MSTEPPSSNGHSKHPEMVDIARLLELRTAERDAALALLRGFVEDAERSGGFLEHEKQTNLRAARIFLETHGLIKTRNRQPWNDRR